MKYELKHPIEHAGEKISELDLKEPTTKMCKQLGMPYTVDLDGMPHLNTAVCAAYISKLAGLPPSVIETLALQALNVLCWMVMGFFGEGAE